MRQSCFKQVVAWVYFVGFLVNKNRGHARGPLVAVGAALFDNVL